MRRSPQQSLYSRRQIGYSIYFRNIAVTSGDSGIRDPEPRIPLRNATSVYVGIRKLSYSYKRTVIVAIQSLRYGTPTVYILYCTVGGQAVRAYELGTVPVQYE